MAMERFAPIVDIVEFQELQKYEDCGAYFKECRCGGTYEVRSSDPPN
jgi:hypothetical protein